MTRWDVWIQSWIYVCYLVFVCAGGYSSARWLGFSLPGETFNMWPPNSRPLKAWKHFDLWKVERVRMGKRDSCRSFTGVLLCSTFRTHSCWAIRARLVGSTGAKSAEITSILFIRISEPPMKLRPGRQAMWEMSIIWLPCPSRHWVIRRELF